MKNLMTSQCSAFLDSASSCTCCNTYFSAQKGEVTLDPSNVKSPVVDKNLIDYGTGKYSVFDVANWFLLKENLSSTKIQKLCYYAQAWYYTLYKQKFAKTDFEAWIFGPVSPTLYTFFKQFDNHSISFSNRDSYKSPISSEDQDFLERVWVTYGKYTANYLEALTHREAPWINARKGYQPNEICSVIISPESMIDYYSSIMA